jgi:hypothetical protein
VPRQLHDAHCNEKREPGLVPEARVQGDPQREGMGKEPGMNG